MMISFCRKSVHSFLGFAAAADSLQPKSPWKSHHVNAAAEDGLLPNGLGLAGLGLITAVCSEDVMQRSPNVLESSSVKSASPPPSPLPPPKKDPGGIGFIDDIGGGVDGLMSCTESLGFESSDERLVNDASQMLEDNTEGFGYGGGGGGRCSVRGRRRRVVVKKFPPPLSSLNQHGHPNFYLRPVRKDGRLELTEIRIERPEILRASREDGRLRLHLIKDDEQDKNENHHEEEEEEAEEEAITEEPEEESITEEPEEEEEEEEEVESFVNEGKMGNNPVNGEGYRRCIEVVNHQRRREHHHHHHHMDVWRQHCVTTS